MPVWAEKEGTETTARQEEVRAKKMSLLGGRRLERRREEETCGETEGGTRESSLHAESEGSWSSCNGQKFEAVPDEEEKKKG